jgi:protein O-mannosyl-transferase
MLPLRKTATPACKILTMFLRDGKNRNFVLICLALALGTFALYWPILHYGFVEFDDDEYIIGNSHVNSGLSWANIVWAFKTGDAANWHPLTWISHMADCQLFGLNAGGHHLDDLLFHIVNTLLLFLLLKNLMGALWRSAFVAALFAWHPMHVESVAWASERKDVLSAFFWMLTLLAYAQFVEKSKVQSLKSKIFYALALFFFACGLMSKPMVVTLPFVLLLLDFWPLNRFSLDDKNIFRHAAVLVVEKIPFFLLSLAGSVVTFLVQQNAGATWSSSFGEHVEGIVIGYARYVSKLFWPSNLAIIYPDPQHWPMMEAVGAALLLLIWTALFILRARQNPYLIFGWLWFLGTLVPVIGVVQVGSQSIADRYTYLPSIGLFILVAWGANDLLNRWPDKKKFLPIAAGVALVGLAGVTSIQLTYWRNSIALFGHAVEVTTNNYAAENCLGKAFEKTGDNVHALICYTDAVKIEPRYPQSQFNLAICLFGFGKDAEGLEHLRAAAGLERHDPEIQYDLGVYFLLHGSPVDAARGFRAALAQRPDFPKAKEQLTKLLAAHPELKTNSAALDFPK